MRDHQPIVIEEFNGLWKRGGEDSCPPDHFTDCNNVQYTESGFKTRDGIDVYLPYGNVVRIYPFNQSLLVLDSLGNLYHSHRANPFTPILSIAGMTDFAFVKFANRAYISPIGPTNEFIYVYEYGSINPARKAGGFAPTTAPTATIGAPGSGNVEQGVHIFAVVYETQSGFLTALSPGVSLDVPNPGDAAVDLTIPVSADPFVAARWVVATKLIDPQDFTGNLEGYQFYFVERIGDNTTTSVSVNFYDAELLDDASHLEDLFEEIPNCSGLGMYHNRLIAWDFPQGLNSEGISLVRVSFPGEPEAISQVDGLISLTPDGKPITVCQEYRDILYIFKSTKTFACNDNDDSPSAWPITVIDQGIGAGGLHSIATIMDSGGVNIDFLLVGHYAGISLFDGNYRNPPITYKIYDKWKDEIGNDRQVFWKVQVVVNSYDQVIYIVTTDYQMLMGDFKNGLDAKNIKWTPWSFDVEVTTICILEEVDTIRLIIGSRQLAQ